MILKGDRLDKPTYRLIQTMPEEASQSVCYKCWHEVFECEVVQKTVSLLGVEDAAANEPSLLNTMHHKHITRIHDAQWDPESKNLKAITFVMPYYEGGSLNSKLQQDGPFSLGQAIDIACQVLDALHYLHVDRRILHRDIKPGNVLLSNDTKSAYLADMGCAVYMDESGTAGARGGTLLYRAPEYYNGRYTIKSDLYSVGLILIEMLKGSFPYASIDVDDVEDRLKSGKRPLKQELLELGPHVPGPLRRLADRLLDPNETRRPNSAQEVQRELERIQHTDWRFDPSATDLTWTGSRSNRYGTATRQYKVTARSIVSGAHTGKVELVARWRTGESGTWRVISGLRRLIEATDSSAWKNFFKEVDSAAAHRAARR
ncbi:serine/threonine-protein kinase [Actinosynnema sp. NPDC049800]